MNRYTKIDVSKAVDEIEEYLRKHNIIKDDIVCSHILCEEIILNYTKEHLCEEFELKFKKKSGKLFVTMNFYCESFDVFAENNDYIVTNVLKNCDLDCSWVYKNGKNTVVLQFQAIRTYLNNLLYIFKFVKEEKLKFAVASFLQCINIGLSITMPILSAKIIENLAINEAKKIILIAVILFAVNACYDAIDILINTIYNKMYNRVMNAIEMDAVNNVFDMEIKSIEEHGTGMFIQRMTSDSEKIAEGFDEFSAILVQLVKFIGILIAMLIVSPAAFLMKLTGILILVAIEIKHTDRLYSDKRLFFVYKDDFSGIVGEMVRGNKDIKLTNSEKQFTDKLRESIRKTNNQRLKFLSNSCKWILLRCEVSELINLLFYILLAVLCAESYITASVAIVLFNYSLRLADIPGFVGNFLTYVKSTSLSAERLYHLVNNREFKREKFGSVHLENVKGNIEFRDVTFFYKSANVMQKSKNVISEMNLTVKSGETVAFVGKSGCGKTTSLNLISKLYNPCSGAVLLDDNDLQTLDKSTIRESIIAISQFPYIFNTSIRENIRLINQNITDEEIENICKKVCLHDEIMNFPNGYETVVGESGIILSGGQRQRLALARSLASDKSKIILLDEATSALDNETQNDIQELIANLHGEKTFIIVAHRLTTIKKCDRIFYFSDGKVLAEGTHEELMEKCNEYRNLYSGEKP